MLWESILLFKILLESHRPYDKKRTYGRYSLTVETTSSSFDTRWGNYDRKVNSCPPFAHSKRFVSPMSYVPFIYQTCSWYHISLCSGSLLTYSLGLIGKYKRSRIYIIDNAKIYVPKMSLLYCQLPKSVV